ncbi:MAG: DUF58 domain-containing protein [Verrucomicrobiales bacterium]|nr:DUF58 domain-containing protein [Verrucomicrobiales bacterium]
MTRFVPNNFLLWIAALVVVPAVTMIVFGGALKLLGLGLIVAVVGASAVDLQLSIRKLEKLVLETPDLVRCTKGKVVEVPVKFVNRGADLPWVRFGLALIPEFRVTGKVIHRIQKIARDKQKTTTYELLPLARGQFEFPTGHVETPSALGLWLIRRNYDLRIEMRVYPNLSVERKRLSSVFLRRGNEGSHAVRQVGKGRDFEQLRDYQPGDDYIDIDWKATARRGMPVTRTYQIERTQEVYVIVDHSRLSAREIRVPLEEAELGEYLLSEHSAGGEFAVTTQLERFLHCSLVLASVAEKQGDLFGFISFADQVDRFIRSRNGRDHYNIVRDALYTLEPKPVAPDFEQLMVTLRKRLTRRALLVMLVDLSDPLTAEHFYEAIPLVSRQHLILVNMVRPEKAHPLFSSQTSPDRVTDIYENLGGHFQWSDLRETGKKLSHLGVELGLPDHEELCAEAVTQYLNVKQRQLI